MQGPQAIGGFAFGVPASLCKAFDDFVYQNCTTPKGNEEMKRNPLHHQRCPIHKKQTWSMEFCCWSFPIHMHKPLVQDPPLTSSLLTSTLLLWAWRGAALAKANCHNNIRLRFCLRFGFAFSVLNTCCDLLKMNDENKVKENMCPCRGRCADEREDEPMKATKLKTSPWSEAVLMKGEDVPMKGTRKIPVCENMIFLASLWRMCQPLGLVHDRCVGQKPWHQDFVHIRKVPTFNQHVTVMNEVL